MAKKKRSTLPKNFNEILQRGDVEVIKQVFDACDVNAVGGYAKETAIFFGDCPDEVVAWLVANGADLSARNSYGRSALHDRAGNWRGNIAILLELGASVSILDNEGNTPLHSAAHHHRPQSAKLLLANGANVNAVNTAGLAPLEISLLTCSNIDIKNTVELARALIAAGASQSERCEQFVERIGQTFEFHRDRFDKDSVDDVSNALHELYEIFAVQPVPRRVVYDGKTPIIPRVCSWQQQHKELWNLLVPSSGPANTVQGELIRISGRIAREIDGNGGVNWDGDYVKMAEHFIYMLSLGAGLSAAEVEQARNIVVAINNGSGCSDSLAQIALAWIKQNPIPLALGKIAYKR